MQEAWSEWSYTRRVRVYSTEDNKIDLRMHLWPWKPIYFARLSGTYLRYCMYI